MRCPARTAAIRVAPMKILFALPGLHKYRRGAEVAFISVARELAKCGDEVTLIGSGPPNDSEPYRFVQVPSIARERFESYPSMPVLRHEFAYEDLSFLPGLLAAYRPGDYDVTLTCNYPFTNWALRRPIFRGRRPPHVFVTQNGDWPAQANNSEYRLFGCDGLVCINPDYYDRNKDRWCCRLVPNGVDLNTFTIGQSERERFGIPPARPVVLMVSALASNKRVELGIEAVSHMTDAHLVVAGDGPLRSSVDSAAQELLPGRFTRLSVAPGDMPALYRSADVFLHLASDESFGNVFVEALACGVPIVAPDTARLRWIVGDDEYLLPESTPDKIAGRIGDALTSSPSHRTDRARRASDFSWTKIAAMYRSFLQEVCDRNAP
uniref:Glycosyl transferase, group 1 n=1 Tax=Rhodopseudomonas palustris (strain BisA53) TaxID=316055 RepID=Q07SM8_RHOP5